MPAPACRLYLITPPVIEDLDAFGAIVTAALDAGDVGALQVRLKNAPPAWVESAVRELAPVCRSRCVSIILNDNPELAAALDCDGVHIGQADSPMAEARRIMGRERIVGVTCHASRHLAMNAAEAGADYVAFGAFFPTTTKETSARADPETLSIWQESMLIPCAAIGGITVDNAAELVAAGADFIAVSAGVWTHPEGAAAAVRQFNEIIEIGLTTRMTVPRLESGEGVH
jgi:thiamine-phosphate pyrophosphorylase